MRQATCHIAPPDPCPALARVLGYVRRDPCRGRGKEREALKADAEQAHEQLEETVEALADMLSSERQSQRSAGSRAH
ncbi:hypothetical protein GCM10029978_085210 [Actinoallomurus acanthiterrae]